MKWATRRSCRTQVVPVSVHHGGRPHHRTQAQGSPPVPPSTGRPGMTSGSVMVPLPTTAAHPPRARWSHWLRPLGRMEPISTGPAPGSPPTVLRDPRRGRTRPWHGIALRTTGSSWDSSSPSHLDTFIRRPVPDSSQSVSVSGAGCEADGTLETWPVLLVSELRHFHPISMHPNRHLSPRNCPSLHLCITGPQ